MTRGGLCEKGLVAFVDQKEKKREGIDTTGRSGNNIFFKARNKRRDTINFCVVQGWRQTGWSVWVLKYWGF